MCLSLQQGVSIDSMQQLKLGNYCGLRYLPYDVTESRPLQPLETWSRPIGFIVGG